MKIDILRDFVDKLPESAAQRSVEWYAGRRTTIGGSEVASVLGKNPYSTFKRVVAQKIGLDNFRGNIATMWGQFFEDHTKRILERATLDRIYEVGTVEAFVKNHKFSPDGLTVIRGDSYESEQIVLVEIKSPYRKLSHGVPSYYMPQLQSGLANLDLCDHALFVNVIYRKCALTDFNTTAAHKELQGELPFTEVAAMGISWIVAPASPDDGISFVDHHDVLIREDDPEGSVRLARQLEQHVDFGKCGIRGTTYLFNQLIERKYTTYEGDLLLFKEFMSSAAIDDPAQVSGFFERQRSACLEHCELNGLVLIGYLPWKAFSIEVVRVERDLEAIEEIRIHLVAGLNVLKLINESEDPEKKYNELFCSDTKFRLLDYSTSDSASDSTADRTDSSSEATADPATSSSSDSSSSSSSSCEPSLSASLSSDLL